jgi:hypothetical protein
VRRAELVDARAIIGVHTRMRGTYYRGYLPDEVIAERNARDPRLYESGRRCATNSTEAWSVSS